VTGPVWRGMIPSRLMSWTGSALLAVIVIVLLISAHPSALGEARRPIRLTASERAFIEQHWRRPIPPQGEPPARFSSLERSLQPADCGACHPAQFADWATSLHSKSMGPGIAGQLVEMLRTDPTSARSCFS